ncbi:MAG: TraM recognition domain-containing protein [Planctomycetaceae bacterium]|nr:TraM recognition domain-containing protein [Planctomycetaceae bacterium]
MKLPLRLGVDLRNARQPVFVNPDGLSRHLHLVGQTGTGKTTSIQTLLRRLLCEPRKKCCLFVIEPMGNLSFDLLRWISSRKCPQHVRDRLVYIEPAREDVVMPFNPLRFTTEGNRYYQTARAVDLILRAWTAQDLSQQPRLAQWAYKAMCAMALLDLPIAMSRYLLHPGTEEHKAILRRMPDEITFHWSEILNAKGNEAVRILESTRNRFDIFYEAPPARRMFGTFESRFNCERFIREKKIVIINTAKLGRIPTHLGNTIGSLFANEIFETAYNMATLHGKSSVDPTYLLMDEFQRFVSPDIEDAIPTCRQMGLRLILAHQSFSQLRRGEIDLRSMVWQAANRLMFANSFEDADIIANELATLTFDPMAVKDQRTSLKQLIVGYRREWLRTQGATRTEAESVIDQRSVGFSRNESESRPVQRAQGTLSAGTSHSDGHLTGGTRALSSSDSLGEHEVNVPIHETIEEIASKIFTSFEEHRLEWMKIIRQLKTGICFGRFADDDQLYEIMVDYAPVTANPRTDARMQDLIERNFEQDMFISASEADRLAFEDRRRLLAPPRIDFRPDRPQSGSDDSDDSDSDGPFRKPRRKP